MLSKYIPKRIGNALIKHVIAVTLFIPYFYTHNYNTYYQDFILANFFALLSIVFICTSWKLDFRRNGIFLCGMGTLLIAYNILATYMNHNYHPWYSDQINTTIAFLFFIVLLLVKDIHALIDDAMIRGIIHMIVVTNLFALMLRSFDKYTRLFIVNASAVLADYINPADKQYSWLYAHKSQYALILLLCIAFFIYHRKYFRNIFTYVLSQGVLLVALYFSDVYTTMAAVLLLFAGQFLDYLVKAKWWKKLIVVLAVPMPLLYIARELFDKINENRNLLTLGSRTLIWEASIKQIQENPNGITGIFGIMEFPINDYWAVTNCHNVFLNHMVRFSIPVGGIYVTFFIMLALFAVKRRFSFLTIFTWIALFIPMTMDQSLLTAELPFFLFMVYCMFFREYKQNKSSIT